MTIEGCLAMPATICCDARSANSEPVVEVLRVKQRWVVVNTQPHKEAIARLSLERLGLRSYFPVILKRVRHARKVQDVRRPLFPGYMFVDVTDDDRSWRTIHYAFGVRRLVKIGPSLAFVPGALIDSIKAREVDGFVRRPAQTFRIGQVIELRSGPFEGLVAQIVEMDEKERLVVLMRLLNQTVRVKIDPATVHVA